VAPLTDDAVENIRSRAAVRAAYARQELARGDNGYILPYQAKIKVNAYLSSHVAFFAGAEGQPVLITNEPPLWRVATALRLRGYGKVADLATVDVNAVTDEVIALTEEQIQVNQKQAEAAAFVN
jgi:hypothetical protein